MEYIIMSELRRDCYIRPANKLYFSLCLPYTKIGSIAYKKLHIIQQIELIKEECSREIYSIVSKFNEKS